MAPTMVMPIEGHAFETWYSDLRTQIRDECRQLGLSPNALLRSLPPSEFFDPLIQDEPVPAPRANVTYPPDGSKLAKRASAPLRKGVMLAEALPPPLRAQVNAFIEIRKHCSRHDWLQVMTQEGGEQPHKRLEQHAHL
jgi:hypothetical protein